MARNVTDAAVLLGAATGVDPNDAATAAQAGHAFTDYTRFLDDEALKGARIGVWRAGTYNQAVVGPVVEPILDDAIDALEAEGATVDRRDGHRPVGDRRRVRRAPVRVQDGHRDVPRDLRPRDEPGDRPGLPADPRRADRVQPGPSRARRALERPRLRARRGDERARRGVRRDPRGRDAAGPGCDRRAHGRERPRRDHRAHERAGLADERQPGRGRPRRPLRVLRRLVGRGGGVGLRRHHRAGRLHRRPADRHHLHRRPLVGAGADRPRLRLRAGDGGPRPAAVHSDDRRRSVPRRPEPPAQLQAQRQQATAGQRDLVARFR